MLALQTYGLCLLIRTGTRTVTSLILRTRTLSDMVALDKRLYTSPRAPTDDPDCAKLARNGCMSSNAVRLSLVEIETLLQLNLWNLGLVWFIVTFHT